jgi:hypothetical protein
VLGARRWRFRDTVEAMPIETRRPGGVPRMAPTGTGASAAQVALPMAGLVALAVVPTASVGALVGGPRHRVAGGVVGGLVGLAGLFVYGVVSAAHNMT